MVFFERFLGVVNLVLELIVGVFDFFVDFGWDEFDEFIIIVFNIQVVDVVFFCYKGDLVNILFVCFFNDMIVIVL